MNNVIAFPVLEIAPSATTDMGARVPNAGSNIVDLAAVRAEESNWLYGRWDMRELPTDIEDWPQELLVLAAADMQESARRCARMLADHDAAHRAKFSIVK